jgi:hypothetical protein
MKNRLKAYNFSPAKLPTQNMMQPPWCAGPIITGVWPFNRDVFTDEDFSPSAVAERSLKDNKNLDDFGLSDSHN